MIVRISRHICRALTDEAKAAYPAECCGLLVGSKNGSDEIRAIVAMTNLSERTDRFVLDPKEQFEAARNARSAGFEVIGSYHSHPSGDSSISELDKFSAMHKGQLCLIVGYHPQKKADISGYVFGDDQILAVRFVTEDIMVQSDKRRGRASGFR